MTDRIFLDANILFSVAYRPQSELGKRFELEDVKLLTSEYAIAEARRNLGTDDQNKRLRDRLESVSIVPTPLEDKIHLPVDIPDKDPPILASALYSNATHLLTGDNQDFGECFGETIQDTKIIRPTSYFENN